MIYTIPDRESKIRKTGFFC